MSFKVPKELEKVPIVFGFELKVVVLLIVSLLLFLMLLTVNFLLGLVFPLLVGIYIYLGTKYSKTGELANYLKYHSESKVIKFDKTIKQLLTNKLNINN